MIKLMLSDSGMPQCWMIKGEMGGVFELSGSDMMPEAVVRKKGDITDQIMPMQVECVKTETDKTIVSFKIGEKENECVSVELIYEVFEGKENSVFLSWGEVKENQGFELIELMLRSLVSSPVQEETQFFHGENRGGYLADLTDPAETGEIKGEERFGGYPNASVLPVMGILLKKVMCVVEVQGYVCKTMPEIEYKKRICLGVLVPYRIRGLQETPNILVNQQEIARIDFGTAKEEQEKLSWLDAAKMVRTHFQPLKDQFFDDKFIYIIQNQLGRKSAELTYQETEQLLQKISNLIDGQPHVAFLTGWSQGGHDTSYPNAFTMNPLLGTEEEFLKLKQQAKSSYNCTVSLNDNFDDMYLNEFTREEWFHDKYVAKTKYGEPETFETWNGTDVSYIASMHKYMKKGEDGEKRITCHGEIHQLEDAILIDALSWWSVRHDWNKEEPASAVDNLRAKFKIIDTFYKRYNIHVLSELIRYPFIGKLSVAFDNGMAYAKPSDKDIPFLRTVLRGIMYYGARGGEELDIPDLLYHNGAKHPRFRKEESAKRITDIYYLNYVPWFLLKNLELCDYTVADGIYDLYLEKQTHIHINYKEGTWYVEYGGNRILDNYRLTCPLGLHKIAFYATENCTLAYAGLLDKEVADAKTCCEEGSKPAKVWREGTTLYAEVKAYHPVMVTLL